MSASRETNGFDYSEALVAKALALSRDDAEAIRSTHLRRGVHWEKKERSIALSRDGVLRLVRSVRVKPFTIDLSACLLAKKNAAEPLLALPEKITAERPVRLTVKRLLPNQRILVAIDADAREWTVIVGDNRLFLVGMELPAAPSVAHPGYYQLVGRTPRARGRWI